MRALRNFSFLFPSLICLAILGQTTRTHAQSAANSALPPPPHAKEIHLKHVLVIAQTKGWEHDSISRVHGCHLQHGQGERPVGYHLAHRHRTAYQKRPRKPTPKI